MFVSGGISDPTHHPTQTHVMHREKTKVKENKGQGEMNLAQGLIQHSAKHFRIPSVDRGKDGEDTAAKKHVMEVGDNEVGVVNEDVDRRRGHKDTGEPADHEHRHKRQRIEHGCGEPNGAPPERA